MSRARRLIRLEREAQRVLAQVRISLAVIDGVSSSDVVLFLSRQDCLRLLNLRVWSQRYHVSVEYILRFLLSYYKRVRRRSKGRKTGLGVRVLTLTGVASRERLEDHILREFPAYELESKWKTEKQQEIVLSVTPKDPHVSVLSEESVLAAYEEKMKRVQQIGSSSQTRYTRAWRGNPWR